MFALVSHVIYLLVLDNIYLLVLSSDKDEGHGGAGGMIPDGVRLAAELCDSKSGRWLHLSTNAPGLQVYTGNFLDGVPGKGGIQYKARQSVCLESQTYPNSTKEPLFPTPWLSPGQTYQHVMLYEFGCCGPVQTFV